MGFELRLSETDGRCDSHFTTLPGTLDAVESINTVGQLFLPFLGSYVHPRDAALCRVPEQPRPTPGQRRRVRHVRRGGAGDHVAALRLVRVLAGNLLC